ncbi:MAG: carbon-nitrogen hydrolase family protein [Eubacterium sp.]
MKKLKVALVQHYNDSKNADLNTKKAIEFIENAKENNADFVLFPECFLTSYEFPEICNSLKPIEEIENYPEFASWCDSALSDTDIHIKKIQETAKQNNIGVVITAFTKGKKYPQNSAYVIDRKGKILLKYSKVHTCDFSLEQYIESGDSFKVCVYDGIKIGIMICYDREYPESARELMLQGAELIFVPNCCSGMMPRLKELSVRAMENMCGIAMANPNGKNMGNSCAYSPVVWSEDGTPVDNEIIVADEAFDGIVYADFDIDEIREYRNCEDLGKYRKVNAYKQLTK